MYFLATLIKNVKGWETTSYVLRVLTGIGPGVGDHFLCPQGAGQNRVPGVAAEQARKGMKQVEPWHIQLDIPWDMPGDIYPEDRSRYSRGYPQGAYSWGYPRGYARGNPPEYPQGYPLLGATVLLMVKNG